MPTYQLPDGERFIIPFGHHALRAGNASNHVIEYMFDGGLSVFGQDNNVQNVFLACKFISGEVYIVLDAESGKGFILRAGVVRGDLSLTNLIDPSKIYTLNEYENYSNNEVMLWVKEKLGLGEHVLFYPNNSQLYQVFYEQSVDTFLMGMMKVTFSDGTVTYFLPLMFATDEGALPIAPYVFVSHLGWAVLDVKTDKWWIALTNGKEYTLSGQAYWGTYEEYGEGTDTLIAETAFPTNSTDPEELVNLRASTDFTFPSYNLP